MAYVLAHMIGNLKIYFGASSLDRYSHWLREVGEPALPREALLWGVRIVLLVAVVAHIHAAYQLTRDQPPRAAGGLPLQARLRRRGLREPDDALDRDHRRCCSSIFHLLDLTWGPANPDFVEGDPYHNVITSFERVPVALVYVIANLALGVHLYHGAWSLFQSMGWTRPWRRQFATVFAAMIVARQRLLPAGRHVRSGRIEPLTLESMVPPGSIQDAWDNHRFTVRLVNASNKRRFKIIVVGTGLAGASRRRDAGRARLRGRGLHLPRLAAAGALDRRPGRDQRRQGLPQRRRQRSSGSSTTRSRAATSARARPTSTGSRRSRTRSSTRRRRRACRSRASTAGCSTTARSAARRSRAPSTRAARPASSCCSAPTRR